MTIVVLVDGVEVPASAPAIPVLDRGFLYGDSVFEVVRTYGGVPFALEEHLERLAASGRRLGIALPATLDVFAREVGVALERRGAGEAYVRIIVTRGEGPITYDPSTAVHPRRVVIAAPLTLPPPEKYRSGMAVSLLESSRTTDDARARGTKNSNYVSNLLAVRDAKERRSDEAVLVGRFGEVLEGASSNVFVVRGGVLQTPPVFAAILEGITRRHVLAAARDIGVPVEERLLFPTDLYRAAEVFITSTLREVMPVTTVDGVAVADGRPGPVTLRLLEAFRARTAGRGHR